VRIALVLALAASSGCGNLFGLYEVAAKRERADARQSDGVLQDGDPADVDAATDAMVDAPRDAPTEAGSGSDALQPMCPAGYADTLFNGTMFKLVTNTTLTWTSAQTLCLADRGIATKYTHLLVLNNDVERGAFGTYLGNFASAWVGYSDRKVEGTFKWVTAEMQNYPGVSDAPWASMEPSADSVDDDCVYEAKSTAELFTASCSSEFLTAYVCECDAYPADTNNY